MDGKNMKMRSFNSAMAEVALTSEELGIINNALNEVCNGIDLEGEFDTRMGCTVEEARNLLHVIHTLKLDMKKSH
jgi:hypothetical protein